MAKKAATKKSTNPIAVPFHIDAKPEEMTEVVEPTHEPDTFTVKCKVSSIGTRFWMGTVFVALESVDGQNLLDLLRGEQEVTLSYQKTTT